MREPGQWIDYESFNYGWIFGALTGISMTITYMMITGHFP